MLLNIETFFGRFHPLIVHLPIGFLLIGVFFYLLSLRKRYSHLYTAVPASLLVGSTSALFACVTGYVLSLSGSYEGAALNDHLRLGIITTVISFIAYFISIKVIPFSFFNTGKALMVSLVAIFVLISFTGHLGGALTHGAEYLSPAVLFQEATAKNKVTDINEAYVYADLVKPILGEKCASCHNDSKKNGQLSVTSYDALIKGGKHGPGIQPGNLEGSEIIKRVSLLQKNKKFMPANGRTPLTWQETELLRWWIEKAAGEKDKKLAEANAPAAIKNYAAAYFGTEVKDATSTYAPVNIQAPPVRKAVVEELKESGFVVKYLHYEPDILDVGLPALFLDTSNSTLIKTLLQVKDNILWLDLSENNISDRDIDVISQLTNLERLNLNRNPITDKGIANLANLKKLVSLNVCDTEVTNNCLPILKELPALQRVYVWNTGIKQADLNLIKLPFQVFIGSSQNQRGN